MQNFTLHTPTKVLFGTGQIAQLTQEIPADARILITYGGGSIKQNGVLDQVHQALKGFDFLEFGGIEPNPTYETLMKAVELCRTEGINFLLAVGGRVSIGWHQIYCCSGQLSTRSMAHSGNHRARYY